MSIVIVSNVVKQECIRFVIKANGKKEHQDGAHDDCVLALGLTEIGRRFMPRRKTSTPEGHTKVGYYGKKVRDDDDDDH